jgi:hypothetical protein
MTCDYCGDEHDVTALCRARGVSRRRFLFLGGMAAAAAVLPLPTMPAGQNLPIIIHTRKMMARVRVTPELLYGFDAAYVDKVMREIWQPEVARMLNRPSAYSFLLENVATPGRAPASRT